MYCHPSDTVRVSFGSCSVKWVFYRRFTEHDPNNIRTKPLFLISTLTSLPDSIRTVTGPLRTVTGKRTSTRYTSLFTWICVRMFVLQTNKYFLQWQRLKKESWEDSVVP